MAWRKLINFHRRLITPRASLPPAEARKELVFNILLVGSLYLVGIATVITTFNFWLGLSIQHQVFAGVSPLMPATIWLGLISLGWLAKHGHQQSAAYLLLALLWAPTAYTSLRWGALIYQAIASYALIIVLAGILISGWMALGATLLIGSSLIILTYLQAHHVLPVDLSWRQQPEDIYNALMIFVTLSIIMLVSWLYDYQLQQAIKRALKSERSLKRERDQLDQKVKQRTQQLQLAQAEKMSHWYRLIEVGKNTAEILHDIKNPLTSASINLEQLCQEHNLSPTELVQKAQQAFDSVQHVGQFITATHHQLRQEKQDRLFSPSHQIKLAAQFLSAKAKSAQVRLKLKLATDAKLQGYPDKYYQIALNLMSNAIEAYETGNNTHSAAPRIVWVQLTSIPPKLTLTVSDQGQGITAQDLPHIFQPFFSTKPPQAGMGLGLSIVKSAVEKDFGGHITCQSKPNQGTTMRVTILL